MTSTLTKPMTQANRLSALREQTGLTLREVAEIVGVSSQSTLHNYESGAVTKIKRPILEALAKLYKVTPDFILYGEGGTPADVQQMSNAINASRVTTGAVPGKATNQAERLRALRVRAGMSGATAAEEAAILAGRPVTHFNVDKWEREPNANIHSHVLRALAKIYNSTVGYIKTGIDTVDEELPHQEPLERLLERFSDEDTVVLPFVPFTAYGSFIMNCQDRQFNDLSTIRILRIDGLSYENAVVIEVRGNSMAGRYPDRSRHVVRPVSEGNWQYATGVHSISISNEMFVIKRITSNKDGLMILTSDSNGEQMEIQLGDILCMWKVGECVYMPAED